VARSRTGSIHVDRATTIFLDEAGMTDHHRLDALPELVEHSERRVDLSAEDLGSIRLGYAKHVYRQQRLGEIVWADVAGCEPLTVKQIGALKVRRPCYP
jgi:hypothetical protein